MTAKTDAGTAAPPARKPHLSLAVATALGLGYLKPGPGTWGSLAGVVISTVSLWAVPLAVRSPDSFGLEPVRLGNEMLDPIVALEIFLAAVIAAAGVLSANRVAKYFGKHDPQIVVIDEVSGQQLALLLGGFGPRHASRAILGIPWANHPMATFSAFFPDWKYFLLGFILFRAFDIWKPFPARQAESLPGGWGIMADDWIAAVYAALGLWIARWLGL
jgi:phosphatidylglycerophosphatase A